MAPSTGHSIVPSYYFALRTIDGFFDIIAVVKFGASKDVETSTAPPLTSV